MRARADCWCGQPDDLRRDLRIWWALQRVPIAWHSGSSFTRWPGRKGSRTAESPLSAETIVTTLRGQGVGAARAVSEDGLVQALTKQGKIKVSEEAMKWLLVAYGVAQAHAHPHA